MTVLVLSLSVPIITSKPLPAENMQLASSLRSLLPDILSYMISFVILGAFWVRHHTMFHYVVKVDNRLLWFNIFFLMTIGFIPFSTALLGRYPSLQLSLIVYGANLIATSISSQFLWIYSTREKLIAPDTLNERAVGAINRRLTIGWVAYAVAMIISYFDPTVTLAIYIVTMFFFVFNTGYGFRFRRRESDSLPPPS